MFAQSKIEKAAQRESREASERDENLMKKVGQLTIEVDWLKKNLDSCLDQIGKRNLVSKDEELSMKRQCEFLELNPSSIYYTLKEISAEKKEFEELIKARLDLWHTQQCYLEVRRLKAKLKKEDNLIVGRKLIKRYMHEMGKSHMYLTTIIDWYSRFIGGDVPDTTKPVIAKVTIGGKPVSHNGIITSGTHTVEITATDTGSGQITNTNTVPQVVG